MKPSIYYSKPSITHLEVEHALEAVIHGWGEKCYGYITKFENEFRGYVGARYSVATSSCTGALQIGLAALGISQGDEVILADTNWVATVAPVIHLGAKPIFIDISEEHWCIDAEKIESVITTKTKAIIVTHLYGNVAEITKIQSLAKAYDLYLIEDAAEAIGSYYQGQHVGTFGNFGVFSFHGTKTITTGEGGMFVTDDKRLYNRFQKLCNHGRSLEQWGAFTSDEIGYKYKISNIQAAIGFAQLRRVHELVAKKRDIMEMYRERLSELANLNLNPQQPNVKSGYWMPTIVFDKGSQIRIEELRSQLKKQNIETRPFFSPLSKMKLFDTKKVNKVSYSLPKRAFNLPSYHDLTKTDIDRVITTIKSYIKNNT